MRSNGAHPAQVSSLPVARRAPTDVVGPMGTDGRTRKGEPMERDSNNLPVDPGDRPVYVCSVCGKTDIERSAWVDYNTGEETGSDPPIDDVWCWNCVEFVGVKEKP